MDLIIKNEKRGLKMSMAQGASDEKKKSLHAKKIKKESEDEIKKAIKEKEQKVSRDDNQDARVNELTEALQRLQADFENSRKRGEKERLEFREYAKIDTIEKFLPILDNLELALKHVTQEDDFTEGIKLIFSQMVSALEAMGVVKIETLGKEFNPRLHEALMAEDSDEPKDSVIEEFQAGYVLQSSLGDRIIRNSKVKVSKGPNDDGSKKEHKKEDGKK